MEYRFEALEERTNPSVIFRGIVGIHAYGTANADSDVDTRGVFTVPPMEYVRLVPPPKQVSDPRNDHTYYSLLRFCELMAESNPTTMEMLYLPDDCILRSTPAYGLLVARRDLFVTQKAVDIHLGRSLRLSWRSAAVNGSSTESSPMRRRYRRVSSTARAACRRTATRRRQATSWPRS